MPLFARKTPMWVFEENYCLLARLLPDWQEGMRYWLFGEQGHAEVEFQVVERHRYTATIRVQRFFGGQGGAELLPDLSMQVRVYDDAQVAEVLAYQDCHRIPPRYAVGNGVEHHRDEKRQVNLLLHEVLSYCARRPAVTGSPDYSPV